MLVQENIGWSHDWVINMDEAQWIEEIITPAIDDMIEARCRGRIGIQAETGDYVVEGLKPVIELRYLSP